MRKNFVNEISKTLKIRRKEILEKDILLHQLLLDLSEDEVFSRNFLLKGGTCLIKHYLGYFRFSEDLDLIWRNQNVFEGLSQKKIRAMLSKKINRLGASLERIASKRNLDFRFKKGNRNYVELGGNNKMVTFKIWYNSEILNKKSFIKIQINFVEKLCFKLEKGFLRSLLSGKNERIEFLFPKLYEEYSREIPFNLYSIEEIFAEKIRTILTRRGVKARDFVDIYLICKKFGIDIKEKKLRGYIVDKTIFALNLYEKYRKNLEKKRDLIEDKKIFGWGEEKELLIEEINQKEFYEFLQEFMEFLADIIKIIDKK